MEGGTHSIWISEQLQELGHEVLVANVRELRAISHSDRKSDRGDAEKLAQYARLDRRSSGRSRIRRWLACFFLLDATDGRQHLEKPPVIGPILHEGPR